MPTHKYCHSCGNAYSDPNATHPTCDDCGTVLYRNPLPVAVCVTPVKDGEKVGLLLVKRSVGELGWALPGGFVELGESFGQGALRELKEETGIYIDPKSNGALGENISRSTPDGSKILIFSDTAPITIEQVEKFKPTDEVSQLKVVWSQEQANDCNIIFEMHAEMADWFFQDFEFKADIDKMFENLDSDYTQS